MTALAGRKILLIGIGFYDYEAAIAAEFRAQGAHVWVESEQPAARSIWRRTQSDRCRALRAHHASLLNRAQTIGPLDDVVVIKGATLDEEFLKALRVAQPTARLTAYHWDSMARFPDLIQRQALFDRVLTFDHADAALHPSFRLRPLFFRPELQVPSPPGAAIDLCFVGWLHHNRLAQVEAIRDQAEAAGLSAIFYLSTGLRTWAKLRFTGRGCDVHSRPIGFADYVHATARARAIIDLPHPLQTGLTMRAVEAIGAGKKLLTMARDVHAYAGFDTDNVHVLDPDRPIIDTSFLSAPTVPPSPSAIEQYSLRVWALDVLGVTEPGPFLNTSCDARVTS
jgi:hypothetical protein